MTESVKFKVRYSQRDSADQVIKTQVGVGVWQKVKVKEARIFHILSYITAVGKTFFCPASGLGTDFRAVFVDRETVAEAAGQEIGSSS